MGWKGFCSTDLHDVWAAAQHRPGLGVSRFNEEIRDYDDEALSTPSSPFQFLARPLGFAQRELAREVKIDGCRDHFSSSVLHCFRLPLL